MDSNKDYITLGYAELDALGELDLARHTAIDVNRVCFSELDYDPWDLLRAIKAEMADTPLALTIAGQCLISDRVMADDVVDLFVTEAFDNGIEVFRIFDPLNDPRNLQTAVSAAKRCGAKVYAGMVYAKNPAYSDAFFAGYAAQLAALGADAVWLFSMSDEFSCRETVSAIKAAIAIPLGVTCTSSGISRIAIDAGADFCELDTKEQFSSELSKEMERVSADAGYTPISGSVGSIVEEQARKNLNRGKAYSEVDPRFKELLLGKYGRTPCPISQDLISSVCGGEALVLVRPADLLPPLIDLLSETISPWEDQKEDVLTYALFGEDAIEFFKRRNARRYCLDLPHAHAERGIHTV